MASVWVRREDLEAGELPKVCVTTGAAAEGTVAVRFDSTPSWTWILLLFGVFPFLIAAMFATQHVRGEVPVIREAVERYHRWRRTGWWLVGLGAVTMVAGWMTGPSGLTWVGAIAAVGGVGGVVAGAVSFVDGRPDRTGHWVRISRAHPTFVAALEARGQTGHPARH